MEDVTKNDAEVACLDDQVDDVPITENTQGW